MYKLNVRTAICLFAFSRLAMKKAAIGYTYEEDNQEEEEEAKQGTRVIKI